MRGRLSFVVAAFWLGAGCGTVTNTSDAAVDDTDAAVSTIDASPPDATDPGGICSSGESTGSMVSDECLTNSCCVAFDGCISDATCNDCLLNPGATNCDSNALYGAFLDCQNTDCPPGICKSPLAIIDPGTNDPNIVCHQCLNANCCDSLARCFNNVDPPGQTEVDACLLCLNGDPTCDPLIMPAANDFLNCAGGNCSAECGF